MADFSTIYGGTIGTSYTLTDASGREMVTGTLQSRVAGPPRKIVLRVIKTGERFSSTADHTFTETKLDTVEAGADVTALSMARLEPLGQNINIFCDYLSTVKSGQLPREMQMTRWKGITDVSASTSWSVETANCTATISSSGLVNITAVVAGGSVMVSSVRDGVTLQSKITISTVLDNPPPPQPAPNASITQSATSTFNLIQATSAPGTVICDKLYLTVPASPKVMNLTAALTFNAHSSSPDRDGINSIMGKWQYRNIDTGGAWTDAMAATQSQSAAATFFDRVDGSITLNTAVNTGGSFVGNKYEFRIVAWLTTSSSPMAPPFMIKSGSATVAWSG